MDFLKIFKKEDAKKKVDVNVIAHGTSGTEIYGGYIYEEYLKDIRGSKWADKVDMMRRSDAIVKMILMALKLPLLSQNWFVEKTEESPEAEWQKKLFEKVLFEDMTNSFTKTLAEILTFNDFGYSLFEKVHGVSFDEELGAYNTVKKLAFRSQRTIESWKVDKNGDLESVYQQAQGDTGRNSHLDARFLVHFAPEMEGDNYEGVSKLRPCYGPWMRKNEFLKLIAAGIEKYAIPTPILEVPADKVNSDEFDNAIEALECYTSNQSAYLTFPEGWKLTVNNVTFDAEKIRAIIDAENLEMVNSVLASFLLLGQSGGGSLALSNDLSDFFAQTLQASADHVTEVIDKNILKDVLNLNRPGQKLLCSLRCDNLKDRADKEFAETINSFLASSVLSKDDALEDFVREKYKYPKKEEVETVEPSESQVLSFAEKKSPKKPEPAQELISELADVLKEFFRGSLLIMSGDFITSLEKANKDSRNIFQATQKVDDPTTSTHKKIAEYLTARYALEAKKQVSKNSKIKLSDNIQLSEKGINKLLEEFSDLADRLELNPVDSFARSRIKEIEKQISKLASSEMVKISDKLSQLDMDKIRSRARVLVDTQASDVYKQLNLTAQSNSDLPVSSLMFEVSNAARDLSSGPVATTGPDILASATVNSIRHDFAIEKEAGVMSATFVAEIDDRTTELCQSLNGTTLLITDPKFDEFTPPLHHNCRSIWEYNYTTDKEVTGFPSLSEKEEGQITLSEPCCGDNSETKRWRKLFKV